MTDDAVVHLAEGFAGSHAQVGQAEAVAVASSLGRALEERGQLRIIEIAGYQVFEVQLLGMHEGGKLVTPLFQLGVKGQYPRPGRNVAQASPRIVPTPQRHPWFWRLPGGRAA